MKLILTDIHTGRQMTVLYENTLLPALGEDGLQYFIFSTVIHDGQPRTDCTVVDMAQKLAIKPECYPWKGIGKVEYIFDKACFDEATSIPEYTRLLREKKII